ENRETSVHDSPPFRAPAEAQAPAFTAGPPGEMPRLTAGGRHARSLRPATPARLAQLAQQYTVPACSTPWPTTLQPQCPQTGASAWIAHSKASKVCVRPAIVTVKALSYSF